MNQSQPLTLPPEAVTPGRPASPIQDRNRTGRSGLGQRPADMHKRSRDFQNQARPASEAGLGRGRGRGYWSLPFGDVLPRRGFVKLLQYEQRRTDRSKLPCSIALFRFDMKRSGLDHVHEIVTLLRDVKRETDILGYLGEDLIGLLLTDTDEQGAQGFVRKLATRAGDNGFSTITKTYPGEHLASLIAEDQERPGSYIQLVELPVRAAYRVKRCLDIIGSITGMVLLSPVMLITALAVAATSPGPVILKQVRLGKKGVPFVFYKFRSMVANSDDRIHREYVVSLINGDLERINQGNPAKPLYKIKVDPRVTKVGRIIRKTSIDELPQLFNVLKGDMSLVGPRPPLPYEAENYQSWHLRRILEAKPGMTGLWQIEGRSKISFDEMVRRDLRYIRSCSLLLDLRILFKTIKVVFRCEGAT